MANAKEELWWHYQPPLSSRGPCAFVCVQANAYSLLWPQIRNKKSRGVVIFCLLFKGYPQIVLPNHPLPNFVILSRFHFDSAVLGFSVS